MTRATVVIAAQEGLAGYGVRLWSPGPNQKPVDASGGFCRVNPWFRLYPIKSQC